MTTGFLMGYPQTSSAVVGNTDGGFLYDSRFGNLYGIDVSSGAAGGLRKWDVYPQGLERRARNLADLGFTGAAFGQQYAITYGSQELVLNSNNAFLVGFNLADMSANGNKFVLNNALVTSQPQQILPPGQLCAFKDIAGYDIVVSRTLTSGMTTGGQELNRINWGQKANVVYNLIENGAVIGSVPDGSGKAAYALGFNGGTSTMHLYRLDTGLTTLGSLTPATIDATWTNVTSVYGITVDQTDGNLILGFATTDAVTNHAYLVKLNSTTAALMWKIPVGTGINYTGPMDMPYNVVKNGTLYYINNAGTPLLYTINTVAGTATSVTFDDGQIDVLHGHQMSEDVSGSVIWYGGWVEGATHPAYIGNYCGTLGNHTGSHMGWRFWPALGGTIFGITYASVATSRKRAWSFVMDGHTFYVLDLGQQGTWVYDQSTNQWAQFITSGYTQWNFANGCMWGQRIVAGDLITTDVWEMQPSAMFDNGATEILHTVTGGIATRSRTYHSVDSFVLACSVGQLEDGGAGASVTLSFSDDQGQTFTPLDTITLTESNFSGEIAWRSLGSFAAPGRVFRIVDTGGFLRIDGADAGIDGFDPASNPAEPGS